MGVLFDIREEKFAQFYAQGLEPQAARLQAGYSKSSKWRVKRLLAEPRIRERIDVLLEGAANRAVLSRMDILDGIKEEWRLARAVSQHGAALKAAEMLGSELHNMFTKKVELGRVGDFEGKSEQELREYILNQMKELGLDPPKLIQAQAVSPCPGQSSPDSPVPAISNDASASAER